MHFFQSVIAACLVVTAMAGSMPQPEPQPEAHPDLAAFAGPEAREVIKDLHIKRAKMEETCPVYVCASLCRLGPHEGSSCTYNKQCGKGGSCHTYCD
jgi:hypothetical protein